MTKSFVLITCVSGTESAIIKNLKSMSSVKDARQIYDSYDIIATVETDDKNHLQDLIKQIRYVDDIKTTHTLISLQ